MLILTPRKKLHLIPPTTTSSHQLRDHVQKYCTFIITHIIMQLFPVKAGVATITMYILAHLVDLRMQRSNILKKSGYEFKSGEVRTAKTALEVEVKCHDYYKICLGGQYLKPVDYASFPAIMPFPTSPTIMLSAS